VLISALSFFFVFTLIAVSHELGHLIWAKKAGIRVYEFALGVGPRLLSIRTNGTLYAINLIPILAYVRIAGEGESPEDQLCPEPEKFYNKTALQRFKALFFGPLMNILLAFVLLLGIFFVAGVPKDLSSEIASVTKGSPADKAGMKPGDRIIAINHIPYPKIEEAINKIHQSAGQELTLSILRSGKQLELKATPAYNASLKAALLGFSAKPIYQKVNLLYAIYYAFIQTLSMVALMFFILWQLVSGAVSVTNLAGPLGIAHITGKYAHSGLVALLNFTALISVNVGVLNLLPLPAFDGGRLFFILLELLRGKPLDPHFENKIHHWGLVVILILFVLISINDLIRIFST
jgi:regulator of sigma E protease